MIPPKNGLQRDGFHPSEVFLTYFYFFIVQKQPPLFSNCSKRPEDVQLPPPPPSPGFHQVWSYVLELTWPTDPPVRIYPLS